MYIRLNQNNLNQAQSQVQGNMAAAQDPLNRLSLDRAKRILDAPIRLLMAAEMLEK